ncbi:MAG: hypothetical protein HUU37_02090 [Bdellovibrionales bacterium]|nr:hypothetical protein [Bdellovibrionales bacterium]
MDRITRFTAIVLLSAAFSAAPSLPGSARSTCAWCTEGDEAVAKELRRLGGLPPADILREVRAQGACVEILDSGRKAPGGFHWGKVEATQGKLSDVTQHKALMGKTLCRGEHEKAKDCATILVASDAPFSTLLHEWLHFQQTKKAGTVCATSKPLWKRAPSEMEKNLLGDFEWDVLMVLWENRSRLPLGVEDRITVASEILEQAEKRRGRHPDAAAWVKREDVRAYLMRAMASWPGCLLMGE